MWKVKCACILWREGLSIHQNLTGILNHKGYSLTRALQKRQHKFLAAQVQNISRSPTKKDTMEEKNVLKGTKRHRSARQYLVQNSAWQPRCNFPVPCIPSTEKQRTRASRGSLNLDSCESNITESSTENRQEKKEVEQITFLENTMEFVWQANLVSITPL